MGKEPYDAAVTCQRSDFAAFRGVAQPSNQTTGLRPVVAPPTNVDFRDGRASRRKPDFRHGLLGGGLALEIGGSHGESVEPQEMPAKSLVNSAEQRAISKKKTSSLLAGGSKIGWDVSKHRFLQPRLCCVGSGGCQKTDR